MKRQLYKNACTIAAMVTLGIGAFLVVLSFSCVKLGCFSTWFDPIFLVAAFKIVCVAAAISLLLSVIGSWRKESRNFQITSYSLALIFVCLSLLGLQLI